LIVIVSTDDGHESVQEMLQKVATGLQCEDAYVSLRRNQVMT